MDPDAEKRRITCVLVLWVIWAIVLIVGDVILASIDPLSEAVRADHGAGATLL